ncbi:type II toxin-antitoxin system RelE/ParE family toxin [Brevundimonas sp. Leaf363]|uniref:type II toxin-antitoxin system RelE/ParE family toxin n=1 Tax=Brevundimonas sp. Leaf363 TaxID=1736353 RepID=UPI002100A7F6|nr:type II toxin-antitoxin system RelE/ParE family toxin [Brevundimonas sp. Leaf363]
MSPIDDNLILELRYTDAFLRWRRSLRDRQAIARITTRLDRLENGLWGDAKSVGGGVTELRLHFGPGYRLYATQRGNRIVILLCGGDKSSQSRDIADAQRMAGELDDGDQNLRL